MLAGQSAIHPRHIGISRSPVARRDPKWTLLGILLVVFLVARPIYQIFQTEYDSSLLDEILVAVLGIFAPFGILRLAKTSSGFNFLLAAIAYFAMILASSLLHDYSFERGKRVFYIGLLLDAKMFVLFFGAYWLSIRDAREGNTEITMKLVMVTMIVVAIINSAPVIYDVFSNGIGFDGSQLKARGPFYRPHGFFHHPVASAQVTLLGFIASLGFLARKGTPIRILISGFIFIILLAHVSIKEILVGFLVLMAFVLIYIRQDFFTKSLATISGIMVIGGILLSPVGDQITGQISYYAGDEGSESVRRALYSGGWDIAADMSPWGSGTSSFASEGSRIDGYSSLYFSYDVFGRWGASYQNDRFLVDVYWPKVMAESGFFGLLFLLITVVIPCATAWRLLRWRRMPTDFVLVSSMAGILVISIASPALSEEFTGVVFYAFAAMALARKEAAFSRSPPRRAPRKAGLLVARPARPAL